ALAARSLDVDRLTRKTRMPLFDRSGVAGGESVEGVDPEVHSADPLHLDAVGSNLVLGGHSWHVVGDDRDVVAGVDESLRLLRDAGVVLEGVLDEHAHLHPSTASRITW